MDLSADSVLERIDSAHRTVRILVVAGVVAALVALAAYSTTIRHTEASVASLIIDRFTPSGVSGPIVVIHLDSAQPLGLQITAECSVSMLFIPSLVALAGLMFVRSTDVTRLLEATAISLLLIAAINLLRIVAIAAGSTLWGHDGYWVMHVVVGSVVSIIAVLAGLFVQVRWGLAPAQRPARAY